MDAWDASNNSTNRRYERGRIYVTDERDAADTNNTPPEIDRHERFNLNQYYNAVEDEQLYMDEYTSLIQRYNDFIVNSNTLFTRMEMTLRENITRAVARQTYYYHQSEDLYRRELRRSFMYRSHTAGAATAPTAAAPPIVPSIPASSAPPLQPPPQSPLQRFGDVLPRLVSRYITTENARQERNNINNNLFSMLYTFPIEVGVGVGTGAGTGGAHPSNPRADGPPTNEQINRSTLNTVFANILSPVNATCPISREEFNDETEITMIRGCNHIFNRASLREWLAYHSTCPMCRRDIREYRPPSLQEPPHPHPPRDIPRNISIDSSDRDHVTFSYDLPPNVNNNNNDEMYRNLINMVANMITNNGDTNNDSNNSNNSNNNNNNNNNNDDDIMEVD
jgi:hypothetical protein